MAGVHLLSEHGVRARTTPTMPIVMMGAGE
jgi:hypothetical protein